LITGASSGVGAGLAEEFSRAGVQLGLCARRPPVLPDGDGVVARQLDVTDLAAVEAFCAEVAAEFGPIDLWINNAGLLGPVMPLRDTDPAEIAPVLDVNVMGVIHGSRTFIRHRRAVGGGGVLVNISSGAAQQAPASWLAYGASKAAVDNLTNVVQLEERDSGLRAYAIAPGMMESGMQVQLRATPAEQFPAKQRFLDAKEHNLFNSPAWVARHILDIAFGDARPPVVWKVPAEYDDR
jgi:NAD(P)-dependent dehydrogenase (short-subunit alcohol dehydrogenase family)